jgi:hypothetical protein
MTIRVTFNKKYKYLKKIFQKKKKGKRNGWLLFGQPPLNLARDGGPRANPKVAKGGGEPLLATARDGRPTASEFYCTHFFSFIFLFFFF